jgi:hypothetical protein
MLSKRIKVEEKFAFKPLNQYKWKPGFEEISSSSEDERKPSQIRKPLKIVDSKPKFFASKGKDVKGITSNRPVERITSVRPVEIARPQNIITKSVDPPKAQVQEGGSCEDVFSYFYNLF